MDVSIVIRTKDEEDWIKPCLKQIQNQKFNGTYEIVLVDNMSKDATVKIAKELGVKKIIKIKKFIPGKAINEGIKESIGKKIILISAHCIPKSNLWLSKLFNTLNNKKIAGTYGNNFLYLTLQQMIQETCFTHLGMSREFKRKIHSFIMRTV